MTIALILAGTWITLNLLFVVLRFHAVGLISFWPSHPEPLKE